MTQWLTGLRDRPSFEWTWAAARRAREGARITLPVWQPPVEEPKFDVAEHAADLRELGLLRLQYEEEEASGCYHAAGLQVREVAKLADGSYEFRGVASTIGNVDRMKRCFLPGAFSNLAGVRVPLLGYHDEKRPVGSSVFTPMGNRLMHESTLANTAFGEEIKELIRAGAIPATSIGWLSKERFHGWRQLQKASPDLARLATEYGLPQAEDIVYFASAEVVENSLVPIPANPMALIQTASYVGRQ